MTVAVPQRPASLADRAAMPTGILIALLAKAGIPERLGLDPGDVGALAGLLLSLAALIRANWPQIWRTILRTIAGLSRAVRGHGPPDSIMAPIPREQAGESTSSPIDVGDAETERRTPP